MCENVSMKECVYVSVCMLLYLWCTFMLILPQGGEILTGGGSPDNLPENIKSGYYVEPTVIANLPFTCRTNQEEIFGPVVTVIPFNTEEEVVKMANSVKYGLSASIWTENLKRAHRVAAQLQSGTVWVNCWLKRDLRMPFGGYKQSGTGREGGEYSIDFYTEQKTVCIQL